MEDPSFPDFAEELAQAAKGSTLISLPKEKLYESFVRILTNMLKKYDGLPPVERRTKIFSMYDLGADATDADLETAVRKEISKNFIEAGLA